MRIGRGRNREADRSLTMSAIRGRKHAGLSRATQVEPAQDCLLMPEGSAGIENAHNSAILEIARGGIRESSNATASSNQCNPARLHQSSMAYREKDQNLALPRPSTDLCLRQERED